MDSYASRLAEVGISVKKSVVIGAKNKILHVGIFTSACELWLSDRFARILPEMYLKFWHIVLKKQPKLA